MIAAMDQKFLRRGLREMDCVMPQTDQAPGTRQVTGRHELSEYDDLDYPRGEGTAAEGQCTSSIRPSLEPIAFANESGQGWTEMGRTSREPAGNANPHAAATQDVASRNLWRPQYRV